MKKRITRILIIFCVLAKSQIGLSSKGIPQVRDIKAPPSNLDWVNFFELSPNQRESLWKSQVDNGSKLSEWDWQWRLAWIKACRLDSASFCEKLLKDSLNDKALVVRTEAVKVFGDLYENTQNMEVVKLLQRVFKDKKNYKRGKPMPIQKDVLFALKRIGGDDALKIGVKLSKKNATLNEYWKKLNKI